MAKELKLRRGTTAEHSTFTGAEGEVTVDTTKDTVVVHDGATAGGVPLAKEADIPTGALASLDSVDASTIDDNSVGAAELNVTGNGTAGQYLASDGDGTMTWTTLGGGGFSNIQVFTSPGTWTNPGTVEKVKVTVVGGGGGGKASSAGQAAGGGGSGGGTAIEVISFPSATNVPVTVGAGGSPGAAPAGSGGTGGTSSFGAYCSATGGRTGRRNTTEPHLSGGTGTGGLLNLRGDFGTGTGTVPGVGGGSIFGGNGGPGYNSPGPARRGTNGITGGGGGGGGPDGGIPSQNPFCDGGTGGPGIVVVEY